jgi:hypothetical protein
MIHGGHQGFETDIDPDRCPRSGMPIGGITVDLHREGHEPALLRETVAERILALPSASLRASASVVSWVRMVPSLGRVTVVPEQRITPVLKRKESRHRPFFLCPGKPRLLSARPSWRR